MRSVIPLFLRPLQARRSHHQIQAWLSCRQSLSLIFSTVPDSFFQQDVELLMNPPPRTKKPFLNPKRDGKAAKKNRQAREDADETGECKLLLPPPPENGLLVPRLIPVAHDTIKAWQTLMDGASKILATFPVKVCRYCHAVHVGPVGHHIASCEGSHNGARRGRHDWIDGGIDHILPRNDVFHLLDRLGPTISHNDRHKLKKVPAIVELCIQAGVDVPGYPTRRRANPVVMIDKKIIDFDDWQDDNNNDSKVLWVGSKDMDSPFRYDPRSLPRDDGEVLSSLAVRTMEAWFAVRRGAGKLMSKYRVHVCGYCPELHVGPKGTKTCDCFAYKHQMRSGHHHWQEASIDDVVPPVYVWHLRDRCGPPLLTELRVFYGAAPAIVELCVQAGAPVPAQYKPMMRLDIAIPDADEIDKAV